MQKYYNRNEGEPDDELYVAQRAEGLVDETDNGLSPDDEF
jgi:hypothetical protein